MKPAEVASALEQGFALHRAGRLEEARKLAQSITRSAPRLAGGHYLLGLVELDAGSPGRALRALAEAKRLGPAPVIDLSLARAQAAANKPQLAITHYRAALSGDPRLVPALTGLALMLANDQPAEAADLLARAVQIAPDHAEAWNNLGSVTRALGQIDAAVTAFERAASLRPNYVRALANLGVARMEAGNPAGAVAALRQALEIDPAHRTALGNLGHALKSLGDHEGAVAVFVQLAETDPRDAEAQLALGLAAQAAKEPDRARAAFDAAASLLPTDPRPPYCLGELARSLGDAASAETAYRAALALDPEDRCGARLGLALVGVDAAPEAPPAAYVAELFDGYAARFDRELTTKLAYRAPEILRAMVDGAVGKDRRFAALIDLGCGTGLGAAAFQDVAPVADGIDLSAKMVELARARGLYRTLLTGGVVEELARLPDDAYDLALAADVLVYLGALEPAFAATRRILRPGGLFAFTVEDAGEAAPATGWHLRDTHRYAHTKTYVETALLAAGFKLLAIEAVSTRQDRGAAVPGLAVIATV